MKDEVKRLIEYIAKEIQLQSTLLYLTPSFYLFTKPLLDEISEIFNISKKEISQCVEEALSKEAAVNGADTKKQSTN